MVGVEPQDGSGGGCGCLLIILAVVVLALGAGWYFAVKENRNFIGSKTIRVAAGEFSEFRQKMSSRSNSSDLPEIEREVHRLINAERASHDLLPLVWQEEIAVIARQHSYDMATQGFYSHVNLEGENPTDRAIRSGYPCRKASSYGLAENILRSELWEERTDYRVWFVIPAGRSTDWMAPKEIARVSVEGWMGSPGHRRNILTARYDRTGIGGAIIGETIFLTQNFC